MSAAFEAVGDVFEGAVDIVEDTVDAVGDIAGDTLDAVGGALESVGDTLENTVQAALDDPIGTIATVATAVYAPYMLPAVSAGRTLANGGDLGDALTSAAISYVAQGVGDYVGDTLGTSIEYGTDIGSQQTAMLAAQTGDMMGGTLGGTVGNAAASAAAGATAAALTGGDIGEAAINALGKYGMRLGVDYSLDAAGNAIDSVGNMLADSEGNIVETPYDGEMPEVGTTVDAFGNEIGDTNPYATPIEDVVVPVDTGLGISESSPDGEAPEFTTPEETVVEEAVAPVEEAPVLVETAPGISESSPDGEAPEVGTDIVATGEEIGDTNPYAAPIEDIVVPQETLGISESSPDGDIPEFGSEDNQFLPQEEVPTSGIDVPLVDPYEVDNVGNRDEADYLVGQTPNLDPLLNKAGSYLKNQFTNQLARNIFGSPQGATSRFAPNLTSLGGVGGASIYDLLSGLQFDPGFSDTVDNTSQTVSPTQDFSLFDPVSNANWAPQTKIGGLGFAGKYINQDADTYYVNKEQDDRARAAQEIRNQPWLTEEEKQNLLDAQSNQSPFFNFDQTDYSLAPWLNTNQGFAEGGLAGHNPEFYSEGGASIGNRYVKGRGDGTSDSVPAMLASGEFVIPADVVSGLGNGDNDAGAKVLDSFMEEIRKHKRGGSPRELPPDSKGPLSYLSSAMTKAKRK